MKTLTLESSLIAAALKGDVTAAAAMLDNLRDTGEGALADILTHRRKRDFGPLERWAGAIAGMLQEHRKALELHQDLKNIDLAKVQVQTTDRHIERKQQAALARKLFKSLGIPHVGFRTPNYSMAHVVDVTMPMRQDYVPCNDFTPNYLCPVRSANRAALQTVQKILATAFPNHDDRSDAQSDCFDSCWSIN